MHSQPQPPPIDPLLPHISCCPTCSHSQEWAEIIRGCYARRDGVVRAKQTEEKELEREERRRLKAEERAIAGLGKKKTKPNGKGKGKAEDDELDTETATGTGEDSDLDSISRGEDRSSLGGEEMVSGEEDHSVSESEDESEKDVLEVTPPPLPASTTKGKGRAKETIKPKSKQRNSIVDTYPQTKAMLVVDSKPNGKVITKAKLPVANPRPAWIDLDDLSSPDELPSGFHSGVRAELGSKTKAKPGARKKVKAMTKTAASAKAKSKAGKLFSSGESEGEGLEREMMALDSD